MAEFSFNCPFCNLELSIDESGIGQEIECPNCKDVLIIPAPSGGTAEVEEERAPAVIPTGSFPEAKIIKNAAKSLDVAKKHPDEATRKEADDFVSLMTPIVKAMMTDMGSEVANIGVQVFGGHGYIREWGMEQFVRDARIAMIYEGTNGIQALDLVGRKLPANGGRALRAYSKIVGDFIAANQDDPAKFIEVATREMGGNTLRAHAVQLVVDGKTTVEEAMRISNQFEDA